MLFRCQPNIFVNVTDEWQSRKMTSQIRKKLPYISSLFDIYGFSAEM